MRACWFSALGLLASSACSFEHGVAGNAVDAAPDTRPIDGPPPVPRWITAAVSTTAGSSITVLPFDGVTFASACPARSMSAYDVRDLVPHPSLPYVYGIETEFRGVALGCNTETTTTLSGLGGPRPVQRIATTADGSIGFFSIDGAGAIGVYRYTTMADGTPVIGGSANGPSLSGAVALVESDAQLFVAGTNQIFEYDLTPVTLALPAMSTLQLICVSPVDILPSGGKLLAFCSDVPDIRRYARTPFTYEMTVGTIGATSRVVRLPGDHAVAARISPPQLVAVDLHDGTPTWTDGPMLGSVATALTASADGKAVVTARQLDPATSELAIWRVDGASFTMLDAVPVAGTITALAVTVPGT